MKTKEKFKKGQLVKITKVYEGKNNTTGIILNHIMLDYVGKNFYEVLWMNQIHPISETWIKAL
jgi:hypothetical protein